MHCMHVRCILFCCCVLVDNHRIITVPVLRDNYAYLITNERTQEAVAVDCGDAAALTQRLTKSGLRLRAIFLTHHHDDHAGGGVDTLIPQMNAAAQQAATASIAAAAPTAAASAAAARGVFAPHDARIPLPSSAFSALSDRQVVPLFDDHSLFMHAIHTPPHTKTHCAFLLSNSSAMPTPPPPSPAAADSPRQGSAAAASATSGTANAADAADASGAQAGAAGEAANAAAQESSSATSAASSSTAAPSPAFDLALFSGDALFSAGCGRFFEGEASAAYDSLVGRLRDSLPPDTLLFSGHEYAEANLAFALSLEPTNGHLLEHVAWVRERRRQRLPAAPTTLATERRVNVFLRCDERGLAKRLGFLEWSPSVAAYVRTLAELRRLKNEFVG